MAKPKITGLGKKLGELDDRPVIAENNEGCAFFKRLRVLDSGSVIFQSLDKTGAEGLILLIYRCGRVRSHIDPCSRVVGVVFDKA